MIYGTCIIKICIIEYAQIAGSAPKSMILYIKGHSIPYIPMSDLFVETGTDTGIEAAEVVEDNSLRAIAAVMAGIDGLGAIFTYLLATGSSWGSTLTFSSSTKVNIVLDLKMYKAKKY